MTTETVVVTQPSPAPAAEAEAAVAVAVAEGAVALSEQVAAHAEIEAANTVAEVKNEQLKQEDDIEWLKNRVKELEGQQTSTSSTAVEALVMAMSAEETAELSLALQSSEPLIPTTETEGEVALTVETPEAILQMTGSPETVSETVSSIKTEATESGGAPVEQGGAAPPRKRQQNWL